MFKKILLFMLIINLGFAKGCFDYSKLAKYCCFKSKPRAARPTSLLITGRNKDSEALFLKYITAAHDPVRRSPTLWQHIKEHAFFGQKTAKKTS